VRLGAQGAAGAVRAGVRVSAGTRPDSDANAGHETSLFVPASSPEPLCLTGSSTLILLVTAATPRSLIGSARLTVVHLLVPGDRHSAGRPG
jgi:hypothetical protein